MTIDRKMILAVLLGGVMLGAAACAEEGPAERLGEQIDEGVEKAGDKLEEAGDEAKDAAS